MDNGVCEKPQENSTFWIEIHRENGFAVEIPGNLVPGNENSVLETKVAESGNF